MKKILIALAIAAQIIFLIGIFVNSLIPLHYGTEVKVKTEPIDPRSLFRGNYVSLSYEFSLIRDEKKFKSGSVIYAVLKKGEDGIYILDKFTDQKPNDGVFLRGRIDLYRHAVYGIEAYFMPKEKALKFERSGVLNDAIVTLGVLQNGRAGIKNIEIMDHNITDETIDIVR